MYRFLVEKDLLYVHLVGKDHIVNVLILMIRLVVKRFRANVVRTVFSSFSYLQKNISCQYVRSAVCVRQ